MKRRRIILVLAILMVGYVSTYIVLSSRGRYEPTVWGLAQGKNGEAVWAPKGCFYDWAPMGFVNELRWRPRMMMVFLPLWKIDRVIWHTPDKCWGKQGYPVHEVKTN